MKVGDILFELGLDSSKFKDSFSKAEKVTTQSTAKISDGLKKTGKAGQDSANKITKSFGKVGDSTKKSLASIKKGILGITAAATAAGTALASITSSKALDAREISNWASTLNMGTTELQQLQIAFGAVGVSGEKTTDILKDISEKVGDYVRFGGGEFKDFAEQIGLSRLEVKGKTAAEVLQIVTARMQKLNLTSNQQTTVLEGLANDLSKVGVLYKDNAKQLKEYTALANESGAIIKPADIESLKKVSAETYKTKQIWEGLKNTLAISFLPLIEDITKSISELLKSGDAKKWGNELSASVSAVYDSIKATLAAAGAVFNVLKDAANFFYDKLRAAVDYVLDSGIYTKAVNMATNAAEAVLNVAGMGTNTVTSKILKTEKVNLNEVAIKKAAQELKETAKLLKDGGESTKKDIQAIRDAAAKVFMKQDKDSSLEKVGDKMSNSLDKFSTDMTNVSGNFINVVDTWSKVQQKSAIASILQQKAAGELNRIMGKVDIPQARSAVFDKLASDLIKSVQLGRTDPDSARGTISQLQAIAAGSRGDGKSTTGMQYVIKELQNFLAFKEEEKKITLEAMINLQPNAMFDAYLQDKIVKYGNSSFGDEAAKAGK